MRHTLLFLLLAVLSLRVAAQQSYTIVASDFQFTPDLLTIAPGDTVWLRLNAGHSFREVTGSAWADNESTPVGAYDIGPFGAMDTTHYLLLTSAPDTLYYICVPHIDMGMKGRIIVSENGIGFSEQHADHARLVPYGRDLRYRDIAPGAVARAVDLTGRSHPLRVDGNVLRTSALGTGLYLVEVARADGRPILVQRVVLP